ncbi:MAG TPA: pyrroline-5-carboxylate reductase [Hyphomicrobiales bacterium]|nr:pyrroline-5-carboxylate reductase [Hyphomicrobiales bacterium]
MSGAEASTPPGLALGGRLVLFGAGKMGGALLNGWLKLGLDPASVVVRDPAPPAEVRELVEAQRIALNPPAPAAPAVLVLAIKPQMLDEARPLIAQEIAAGTLVVSILAGKTLAGLARGLPAGTAVVRAMPNTPAAIGRGITVAVANAHVAPAARAKAEALLAATGEFAWIDDEALMDAVTAVSGSGPAYVFLLAESLARAGIAAGLVPALAERLARATVAGSGALLERSEESAEALRRAVTSPGGTTAAALEVLMSGEGLAPLLERAVRAAAARSRALAG